MRPLVLLAFVLAAPVTGQTPSPTGNVGLSDSARVSLLTMLPGDEVYSLWGHNALRIEDAAAGLDRAYNYGTFSFEQPNFTLRFLSGRLDYILDAAPYADEVAKYRFLGRPVIEQTLALEAETVRALYDILETNALPQNRSYRYDFLRDNCSTRLLEVVNQALTRTGHPPVRLEPPEQAVTFRELVRPYAAGHPLVDLGTMLGLGTPMDQEAQPREAIFLPDALSAALEDATVDGEPLVAQRDTVFWVEGADVPEPAFPWPTALAWVLFVGTVTATVIRPRGRPSKAARWGDAALLAAVGGAGTILLLLWIATDHYVTEANVELLWMWPTHAVAAVAFLRPDLGTVGRRYAWAAAGATIVALLGWALWPEPMHPALAPLGLLLTFRLAWRGQGES
ncbi:DUF4105 domain-containing protein [Rubrivirga sp.]|uniref:Lnb N-terminal periplasmic domain-containing protein n=1 Tax=Rubrivirga sp. TaxID=1885344 RepID=UPI003C72FDA8